MDPTKHNAAALHARVDKICNALIGHFANVAGAVKEDDPKTKEDPKENDYSSTAQKELTINEEIASFIRAGQDLSVLIRELQEVWLFGGLDTLIHEAHTDEAKAFRIATLMEELAKGTAKPKDVEKGMGKQAGFG
ncbi:uncharacterized protein BDR25DRAFT_2443 [Lindgomyces ingoldianus]|uniref:Uncharacterized protein n=1 Tax=Lindgomyces ingoldianus TaxID=673940 RepID=A0ACB6REC1_9PLEO|nr:uncharacterized protein BDR25DRAFT_2443 [Lindgomyces ingoldianus]KAF2477609.1 hypothetical protein BDR25DRAFT_2443 [Lindgomyces ingoldianus]